MNFNFMKSRLLPYGAAIVFILVAVTILFVFKQEANQLRNLVDEKLIVLANHLASDELAPKEVKEEKLAILDRTQELIKRINSLFVPENNSLEEAKAEALKILAKSNYVANDGSEFGYYFVYDSKGVSIFHPIKTESWVGENKLGYQDKYGKFVIKDLIDLAIKYGEAGAFDTYMFHMPSKKSDIGDPGKLKLAYVAYIKEFDWIIGTGFYLGPFDEILNLVDQNIEEMLEMIIRITDKATKWIFGILSIGFLSVLWITRYLIKSETQKELQRNLHTHVKQDLRYLERVYNQLLDEAGCVDSTVICVSRDILNEHNKLIQKLFQRIINIQEGKSSEIVNLIDEVNDYVNEFQRKNAISVGFTYTDEAVQLSKDLGDKKANAFLNIIKEALENARLHANALHINIHLYCDRCSLFLRIQDDGTGFDFDKVSKGVGIHAMHYYVREVKGSIEMNSSEVSSEGTIIIAKIPHTNNLWSYISCLIHKK